MRRRQEKFSTNSREAGREHTAMKIGIYPGKAMAFWQIIFAVEQPSIASGFSTT